MALYHIKVQSTRRFLNRGRALLAMQLMDGYFGNISSQMENQVKSILGEPQRVETLGSGRIRYYYSDVSHLGYVDFDMGDRVRGWTEP